MLKARRIAPKYRQAAASPRYDHAQEQHSSEDRFRAARHSRVAVTMESIATSFPACRRRPPPRLTLHSAGR
jgi:hypothetical protein